MHLENPGTHGACQPCGCTQVGQAACTCVSPHLAGSERATKRPGPTACQSCSCCRTVRSQLPASGTAAPALADEPVLCPRRPLPLLWNDKIECQNGDTIKTAPKTRPASKWCCRIDCLVSFWTHEHYYHPPETHNAIFGRLVRCLAPMCQGPII